MDVDKSERIAGIRPAVLKTLLRKIHFDTPTAMKWLELPEPRITETLTELQRDGWIASRGTHDGTDRWETDTEGAAAHCHITDRTSGRV